eukprot:COSAG04_NODE_1122_length_8160_cov_5.349088_2_plen_183_part_00
MAAEGKFMKIQPTPEVMHALELCISDRTKPVLLANERFIPYLIAGLGLAKLRDDLPIELREFNETMHAECFAQLAAFEPAHAVLQGNPAVVAALETVAQTGLAQEAREMAQTALSALSQKFGVHVRRPTSEEDQPTQKHVMLSYQWSSQSTIIAVNDSLVARGYLTWLDVSSSSLAPSQWES